MSRIPVQRTASTAATPSSLTQARPTGTCPACASARLTVLAMTLTDGTPVRFASCHDCEHRSWSHEGEELQFADVIARATKQKV
jgi:formate dehydrogenase maturation protein FdhE